MSIAQRLAFSIGLLLALSIGGAVVAVWCAKRVDFEVTRMESAQRVYEQHLLLSNNAYLLFKQYGDQLVIGDLDGGAGETELARAVQANIRVLRDLIAEEIALVGAEDIEELESLDLIEAKINEITRSLALATNAGENGSGHLAEGSLTAVLDQRIDLDFRAAIDAALIEERREIEEARSEVSRALLLDQALSLGFALMALGAAAFCAWLVDARVRRPAQDIIDGTLRLSAGDFSSRLNRSGADEFARLAGVIDLMAAKVEETTGALAAQNTELSAEVDRRTQDLRELLDNARKAEAARRQLLADVSHELRTPLTVIRGEADVALRLREPSAEAYRQALQRARDAATHTARLVDDLLFIARAESAQVRLAADPVDLRMLLADLIETFANDVTVVATIDTAPVRADGGRLRQAVLVLIENARRHGGGSVLVRLDQSPDGYRIAVEDDGPGMGESDKKMAFERFYRGTNANASYRDGVGLGLPIARAIIEAHGGRIALEDRPGGGLIAALLIPVRPVLKVVS